MTDFFDELPPPSACEVPAAIPTVAGKGRANANKKFAQELRANPGKWCAYPHPINRPELLAKKIRNGGKPAFPKGEFDAEARNGIAFVRAIPPEDRKPT